MQLKPILVAAGGRSGSTALMALLGSDPRVAFDRVYPFEHRYLTHLAKVSALLLRRPTAASGELFDFNSDVCGGYSWNSPSSDVFAQPADWLSPAPAEWLAHAWELISRRARALAKKSGSAEPSFYAEKAAIWTAPAVRDAMACLTAYLFRDPRDQFLSVNSFNRARGFLAFGRTAQDSDADFARNLALDFLSYFENYRADADRRDCALVRYEELIADPV